MMMHVFIHMQSWGESFPGTGVVDDDDDDDDMSDEVMR